MAFLDGTRVTRDALPPLVPPCAAAGHARRAAWRMEGKPRTARRLPVDPPGPLPTPAARRCCWRPSLQPSPLHGGQGRVCGRGPGPAPPWRPVRGPARRGARRALGAAPTRSRPALAPRLGVSEAAAAPVGTPRAAASARPARRHRRPGRGGRQRPTPCPRSGASRPPARASGGARRRAAAALPSGGPRPRRSPGLRGGGGDRRGAGGRSHSPQAPG